MKLDFVSSMEAPSKVFLLFFLLPDWLKLNHLEVEWNVVFRPFFEPYLFDRSRNNRRYKQPSKFWREKIFRKPHFKLLRWFLVHGTNKTETIGFICTKPKWRPQKIFSLLNTCEIKRRSMFLWILFWFPSNFSWCVGYSAMKWMIFNVKQGQGEGQGPWNQQDWNNRIHLHKTEMKTSENIFNAEYMRNKTSFHVFVNPVLVSQQFLLMRWLLSNEMNDFQC